MEVAKEINLKKAKYLFVYYERKKGYITVVALIYAIVSYIALILVVALSLIFIIADIYLFWATIGILVAYFVYMGALHIYTSFKYPK
jgi:hypothetical protein